MNSDTWKVDLVVETNGLWAAWKLEQCEVAFRSEFSRNSDFIDCWLPPARVPPVYKLFLPWLRHTLRSMGVLRTRNQVQPVNQESVQIRPINRLHPKDIDVFLPDLYDVLGSRCLQQLVDQRLLRHWMKQCEDSHGSCCSQDRSSYPSRLILIDVKGMRLHDTPLGMQPKYLALSYTWGDALQPVLTQSNGELWHAEGGLKNVDIPRKIRDAMQLTRMIGYEYLWVDALCIVQDDDAGRHHQISQMHKIYQQADLTIIAADSEDCNKGLSGISTADERVRRHETYELPGRHLYRLPSTTRYSLDASIWRTRGWTFQEELCSRKTLTVLPELMIFTCPSGVWREDLPFPIGSSTRSYGDSQEGSMLLASTLRGNSGKVLDTNEGISLFQDLVKQYMKRNLRRSDDIENAFAGVAGMLEPFVGPLYHGIPEQHFDEIVHGCWYWETSLHRRSGFPSWSWTGWAYRPEQADIGIKALKGMCSTLACCKVGPDLKVLGRPTEQIWFKNVDLSGVREHFRHDEDTVRMRYHEMQLSSDVSTHLIAFFTSIATLELVGNSLYAMALRDSNEYLVVHPESHKRLASIRLSSRFVNEAGLFHQFIVVACNQTMSAFRLMLISFREGIAERVNVTVGSRLVSEDDWLSLEPRKELIFMG